MTDLIAVLLIMLIPSVLSLESRWFLGNRDAKKLVTAIALVLSGSGVVAFAGGLVSSKSLVAMVAPSFQVWLAHTMAKCFQSRHGRTLKLFAYETVHDRELLADARYSAFYFVVAIAMPLLTIAPFLDG